MVQSTHLLMSQRFRNLLLYAQSNTLKRQCYLRTGSIEKYVRGMGYKIQRMLPIIGRYQLLAGT